MFEKLNDRRLALFLCLLHAAFCLPALNALEFFRHTEADRTLLGWEMFTSGDYIVPHLLGDAYLTKPPAYYWLLSAIFGIVGEPTEAAARSISFITSSLLVGILYYCLRRSYVSRQIAVFSSLILSTSYAFYIASVEAEIDMTFTFFCSLAMLLFFNGITGRGFILAWLFAACAFLTKGPQIFVFMFFALAFAIYDKRKTNSNVQNKFLFSNTAGVLLFVACLGLWLDLLLQRIPASDLWEQFKTEILQRFTSDPRAKEDSKPFLYYIGVIFLGLFPWSIWVGNWFRKGKIALTPDETKLIRYALWIIIPSILIFSVSSGKSGRYVLPLYPLIAFVLAAGLKPLLDSNYWRRRLAVLVVCLFALKIPYFAFYAPYRNHQQSVKPLTQDIIRDLGASKNVMILEMFERWVCYYLIRNGIDVKRLTPEIAAKHKNSQETAFLFINSEKEAEKINLLPESAIKRRIKYVTKKRKFELVELNANSLSLLNPKRIFPTN